MKSLTEFWLPEIWELTNNAPVVFVGNKSDLVGPGSPDAKTLEDIASKVEMPAILASAKTGDNVELVFRKIGELMLTSDFGGKKMAEPTAESLAQAVDEIVTDFCDQFGDTPRAMEIVDREFQKANVDLRAPSKDSLLMAIEYLSDIERDTHGRDVSEVNKLRRWKMVDEAR
jgi:50S ribosomal subunit-associated GTPase HflX